MVTALDANIYLDVVSGDANYARMAIAALLEARKRGPLVMSAIAYAEIAVNGGPEKELNLALEEWGITIEALDQTSAFLAGELHRAYRRRGGSRSRILADFLIAAHATVRADCLLTRDARFFTEHFPDVNAIHPASI